MSKIKNYTIIHGNLMYNLDNVEYDSSSTHRRFKRNEELVLSVPLSSTLILRGQGISAKLLPVTQPAENLKASSGTTPAVPGGGSDNFIEGMVAGVIMHEIFFD